MAYDVIYRTLQRLARAGLVTGREPDHGDRGRRPFRLTQAGIDHTRQSEFTASEPPITVTTAQILLALLQPPIRSWRAADLANRVPCHFCTVVRLAAAMEPPGWATTRRSTTERNTDITLTEHGVNHAKSALRREYGDGPALVLLANSMRPPVSAVWE